MFFYGGRSSVGRAPGCDPGRRGFESHRPPQFSLVDGCSAATAGTLGPLAQLVEQWTLNPQVRGSIPRGPTIFWNHVFN